MDIAAWLRQLGLERYEEAFRENEIDAEILPKLTADDLKDLGVTTIGHRRKLLEAIAALAEPASVPQVVQSAPTEAPPRARSVGAERRQLTVVFCDLVGSTELAARLDPEDMGRVIRAYQDTCTEMIERWGGHVAKYMGDGLLAYFGWPRAHEDEAERAVRSGLAMIEALAVLETPAGEPLAARVGIATGLVMVGELIGVGAAQEQTVVGETPNLAARLQTLAQPGSVVISQATRHLLGGLFELTDLGPTRLKGFAEPLAAFRVEGEGRVEGRFEALHGEHLTPLVGREHELGILLERWAWAKDGDGQVVLLSGEPGIGKSRLLRALRERLGDEPYRPLSHYCSPYYNNTAFHPVIGLLERAARLDRDEPPEAKLAKLEAVLVRSSDQMNEVVPLIAALLGVPTGDRCPALTLTPEVQKRRTLQALVDQLTGLAAQQPVLALYEDVHWIDPSTLELLGMVIERIRQLPVLSLITFRPEFQPPWTGHPHVTTLTMSRLGRRQRAELVVRVTGDKPLPAEILDQIVARTDGIPLFVEELTKTVLESGLLADAGDRYALTGPLTPLAIPTSLHDSLMARLDRLAPLKEVAQIGAVFGREFSHELLAAVSPLPEDELDNALDQLASSELVFRRGTAPEAIYTFKHALVQDAAYQSLLKSKRQQLHARIAQTLEERSSNAAEMQPELLAHHFTEAGLAQPAVENWLKAGELAIRRSAIAEAIAQLRKGLELVASLPDDLQRTRLELELQTALGGALIAARGFAAPETGEAYTRARELCRQRGQPPQLYPVLYGQYAFHLVRAELDRSITIAQELLLAAQDQHETAPLVIGHRSVGIASHHRGELAAAREHLELALARYDASQHRALAFLYVFDPFVASASYLSCGLFALGHPEQAQARAAAALARARELAHPSSMCFALIFACFLAQFTGNRQAFEEQADELLAIASEHGFAFWAAHATIFEGWALAEQGRSEGVLRIRQGIAALTATGAAVFVPHVLGLLAQAQQRQGQVSEAEVTLTDALEWVRRTGERYYEAELLRHRGELLLAGAQPDLATAEWCLAEALETARDQQARMWELRAVMSRARLLRGQGRGAEAHDLLAPVYGWFTEGFDTADLKDAKALLDELR